VWRNRSIGAFAADDGFSAAFTAAAVVALATAVLGATIAHSSRS
jgi:VIT1/CCC1 family predicted Fe2+/Mn2+ transporter